MAGNRPLWRWSTALLGGLFAGVALPPWGCPPLLWLALLPLWALPPRQALLFGGAAVLCSHRWLLWLHPLDWVGVPLPLSLPLCVLLWLAIGALGAGLVFSWRSLVQRLGPQRPTTAVLAAVIWGLMEVLLAKGPLFWLGLGSAALPGDRALAGLAQWLGAGGLAALQLGLAWWMWRWLRAVWLQRSGAWRAAMAWLVVVLALHGTGWLLLQRSALQTAANAASAPVDLLVLQPAIPTREKFSWRQQRALLRQLSFAQAEAAALEVQALLLPEGALPLAQALPEVASTEVLGGGFHQVGQELRSALLRFPVGSQRPAAALDKHRLVPLGEWIPGASLLRWSGLSAVGGVSPGAPDRLMQRSQGDLAVVICYELADGAAVAKASRQGAGWVLATANLDPYPLLLQHQFAALAQLRAIESQRWLVSAANTGPSLVVDAEGVVQRRLPPFAPGTLPVQVVPRNGVSGYGRWGELPLAVLAIAGTIARRPWMRQS